MVTLSVWVIRFLNFVHHYSGTRMKRHKKMWTCLLSLLVATSVWAQQTGKIEGEFNVDGFPEVSFIYHSYNPDLLHKSDFWYLKESGNNREFNVIEQPVVANNLPQITLILWEDMAHNGYGQFNFTQKVLSGFFSYANIPTSDKFAISAFNRRKNTPSALINLTNGFTNNKEILISTIQSYRHSQEHYPEFPNRSDMYTAIREGMELLAPMKGVKAIIVFTSGYSMKNSGSDSEVQVLLKAQQLHIPVYIFQYYYKSGVTPEPEGFAKSTFGSFNSYMDVATAEKSLINLYPQISKRYQGKDYKVSFTSNAKRGTSPHMITFSVNGAEIQKQLVPPSHTFWTWVSENLWGTVLIVAVLIAVIIGIVLLVLKTNRNAAENKALEARRIQDKEAAEEKINDFKNKALQEKEEQKRQAEKDRLRHIMEVKNIYPRLICREGTNTFTYEINELKTRIGRERDNELKLTGDKVSRHHAEIVFNGSGFEIIDKQSSNKVIVNGQFVDHIALKNGDIIGLGEAVLEFYI